MLKPYPLLALGAALLVLVGCSSKPEPDLYEPGDIPTWRTVDTVAQQIVSENRSQVVIETSMGAITIELFDKLAPLSTTNFLQYVASGHYVGTVFHRVIPGFMIQGGGLTSNLVEKPTGAPILNESNNGVANRRGTVAMARTSDPNSATSQFFINLVDNAFLNGDRSGGGYAVFGRVISGMDIIDAMAQVATGEQDGLEDVPVTPIPIISARQVR